MNIYGDTGNRIVLEKRLEWRGIPYQTHLISVGDPMPKNADIIIGGGGQDRSQIAVAGDLMRHRDQLKKMAGNGVVMLMVCGMYQLFGRRFLTSDGQDIKGIGILPVETIAGPERMIGNITVDVGGVGVIVGYENHSGRTLLDEGAAAFGCVISGMGNSGEQDEGCRVNNVIGTYMHGPVLSKNPALADYLLLSALRRHDESSTLIDLDDSLEKRAQESAMKRPR